MDAHKDAEFLKYGCLSRAIMKVCGQDSVEDFCSKYEQCFRPEYYGMPRGDKIGDIFADFGYAIIADEHDYGAVLKHFKDGNHVIVASHINLNKNDASVLNHASVLHDATDNQFVLWTATQSGWAGLLPAFDLQDWTDKKCHGLLLKPR